jgi:hypothetical protein
MLNPRFSAGDPKKNIREQHPRVSQSMISSQCKRPRNVARDEAGRPQGDQADDRPKSMPLSVRVLSSANVSMRSHSGFSFKSLFTWRMAGRAPCR